MANDIKLIFDTELGSGNFELNDGDLTRENGLETAVIISLFTDQRASEFDDLDDINDKRGWWGDQLSEFSNDKIGSKLWLLDRAKTTTENLELTQQYILESLEWMVQDLVVRTVECEVERQLIGNQEHFVALIKLYKFDNTVEIFRFDDLWDEEIN